MPFSSGIAVCLNDNKFWRSPWLQVFKDLNIQNFCVCRFWEDQSDEFKDIDGSLLPLWRFSFEAAKNLEITSLCWNPKYDHNKKNSTRMFTLGIMISLRPVLVAMTSTSRSGLKPHSNYWPFSTEDFSRPHKALFACSPWRTLPTLSSSARHIVG